MAEVLASCGFATIASHAVQILQLIGYGHIPAQTAAGDLDDLPIFIAEAFVLSFVFGKMLAAAIMPRIMVEYRLVSHTLTTFAFFAGSSLAMIYLFGRYQPLPVAAMRSGIFLALRPFSSI